jgi:transcriptional regulator PpsR
VYKRQYWKLRQTESHYRVLFQVATDAVCVLDADSLCLLDANQAAIRMFDAPIEQLIGKEVTLAIDAASKPAVEELLTSARASGRAGEIRARLTGRRGVIALSATPFRAGGSMRLLLRARSVERREDDEQTAATISALVERMLDAVVVTDSNGRILMANPAFVELTRRGSEAQVKGRPLSDWVGMTPGEVTTMVARARRVGIVPFVATSLRGPGARPLDVQASAALLPEGDQECVGFTLRLAAGPGAQADHADLLTALDRLAVQIGKPSLPELMQRVTELAERHIVVGALDRAGGDRRAAADALGISAHDLEQRLRRLQHPLSAGNGESRPAGRAAAGDGPSTPAS